jgi:hypothetical protein
MPCILADGWFITPIGISRIATPSCEYSLPSKIPISRFPGWLTAGLHYASVFLLCCDDSWPPLIGISRLRDFEMLRFRVHEIPDTPIPDFPMGPNADGSRWLPPVPQMDGSNCYRDIANRDSNMRASSMSSKTLISRSTTLRDLLTRVTHNGRSRSDREIAYRDFNLHKSHVSENPDFIRLFGIFLTRVTSVWTVPDPIEKS